MKKGAVSLRAKLEQGRVLPVLVVQTDLIASTSDQAEAEEAGCFWDVAVAVPYPVPVLYFLPFIVGEGGGTFWELAIHPLIGSGQEKAVAITRSLLDTESLEVVFLDALGAERHVTFASIDHSEAKRKAEISEVLELLATRSNPNTSFDLMTVLGRFREVLSHSYKPAWTDSSSLVPPGSSPHLDRNCVVRPMVKSGRLLDRRFTTKDQIRHDSDLFVSYAHPDSELASAIFRIVSACWPRLRIQFELPDVRSDEFIKTPGSFMEDALRSKYLLAIATPSSLNRPMVETEIGLCCDGRVLVACIGVSSSDFIDSVDGNLFMHVKSTDVLELSSSEDLQSYSVVPLLDALENQFGPAESPCSESHWVPAPVTDKRDRGALHRAYARDMDSLLDAPASVQSMRDAGVAAWGLVSALFRQNPESRKVLKALEILKSNPFALLSLLMAQTDNQDAWHKTLEYLKPLDSPEYLRWIEVELESFRGTIDPGSLEYLRRVEILSYLKIRYQRG